MTTADLPLFATRKEQPIAVHIPASVLADLHRAAASYQGGGLFTAESLRDRLSFASREILAMKQHRNVLGGFLRGLVKARSVEHAGWTVAQRGDARSRALRMWRSK